MSVPKVSSVRRFYCSVLTLLCTPQVFPAALLPPTYSDPDNPERLCGRSEVERRSEYIQPLREQLGEQHPLLQLVCQCLHNTPAQRPSAEELLQQLEAVSPQIKRAYASRQQIKVEMAKLQVVMMSMLETDAKVERLQHDVQQKDTQLQQNDIQLQQKDTQLQQKDDQIQRKNDQIERQGTELRDRGLQLNRQLRELQTLRVRKKVFYACMKR